MPRPATLSILRLLSVSMILLITQTLSFTAPSKFLWSQSQKLNTRNESSKLNLLSWFGNDDKKKEEETNKYDKPKQSKMGSTAKTMENFKQSQELGKKTSALLNELSTTTVEGVGAKGKIKVTVDGQQRPKLVDVDEDYFNGAAVEDFTEALAVAMQDAHDKSTKLMEEKMNGLYADLGLPSTKN